MNSSGIKRGLAATAVAALAVTGLPFLASSASAALGDEIVFVGAGPTRDSVDATAIGGYIALKTKGLTTGELAAGLEIKPSDASTLTQTVVENATAGTIIQLADGPTNPFGGQDGYDVTYLPIKVDTATTGGTANYTIFMDEAGGVDNEIDSNEARAAVTQSTAGAPVSIEVSPVSQSAPTGSQSGKYVATVKDDQGRTTQPLDAAGEYISLNTNDANTTVQLITADPSLQGAFPELAAGADYAPVPAALIAQQGGFTFKAKGTVDGDHTVTIDAADAGIVDRTVTLKSTAAVSGLTASDLDIVTGADTWDDTSAFGAAEQVRVDQTSIKLAIADDDGAAGTNDNASMSVTFTGTGGVKFDGETTKTQVITLDDLAKGSITVTPDANTVTDAGGVTITSTGWTGSLILNYARASASTAAAAATTYVTKIGSATDVTVTVKDQFGDPVSGTAQVQLTRGARNGGTTTARTTVNASGQATFSLPDAGTTAGTESVSVALFTDAADGGATAGTPFTIRYTADGVGADFSVTGATADAAATVVPPVYDAKGTAGTDAVTIGITGGTPGAPATVSVNGGALVMTSPADVANGASSKTITLNGSGAGSVLVAGTKTGVITVTVASAGRTKTVELTVKQPGGTTSLDNARIATARNVSIEGPAKATAGEVAVFTATVTDAFGNPVAGVSTSSGGSLAFTANGPGNIQSVDPVTDANGQVKVNVLLTDNADSPVTVRVNGLAVAATPQFGKAANTVAVSGDAPGLTASESTDAATIENVVNLEDLEQAVADAQEKVDNAQDNVDAAKGDLAVAKAERSVAQKAVKSAKKDLRQAKKHHKGVKAARKALREARGDKRVANAKVSVAQAKVNTANERLADAQAELEAAQQALEDAQK